MKDVLVAAASVVGASVAVRGLNTWNRQLKGGAEYELARRILKVTYRLRDAIKGVRHPVMWPEEMVMPAEGAAAKISDDEVSFDGTSRAYDSRWQKVADLRTELQTELLEAEVLWGNELGKRFQALYKLEHELMIAIRSWLILRDPKASEAQKNAVQKHQAAARDIMYDELSEEGDKFTKDVVCAIGPIEEYLKPHLRR
ncbi:MAG TPA: hypothetical protein VF713_16630 [Thermoanaerobaculia bacterium]